MTAKGKKTKATKAKLRSKTPSGGFGGVVRLIGRNVFVKIDLSPVGVRNALAALTGRGSSSSAQLRLDPRTLRAIYVVLGPVQVKNLVARLRALTLSEA